MVARVNALRLEHGGLKLYDCLTCLPVSGKLGRKKQPACIKLVCSLMKIDQENNTFDCAPTLTDSEVLQFCRDGYMVIEGVVPTEINDRTRAYLDGVLPTNPSYIPDGLSLTDLERMRQSNEPSPILLEEWFIEHVLVNLEVAGVLRSLLGRTVGLPIMVSDHSVDCPGPPQVWHNDDDSVFGPDLNYIEVFYLPQDTPIEFGPTEVLPGSHVIPADPKREHQGVSTDCPAGSFVVHFHSILHRRKGSTAKGRRYMLKYDYWRTVPPERDWIIESDFNFHRATYAKGVAARYVAHMFYWLCGKGHEFRVIGGQGWPWKTGNQLRPSYGFDSKEGYVPDWKNSKNSRGF